MDFNRNPQPRLEGAACRNRTDHMSDTTAVTTHLGLWFLPGRVYGCAACAPVAVGIVHCADRTNLTTAQLHSEGQNAITDNPTPLRQILTGKTDFMRACRCWRCADSESADHADRTALIRDTRTNARAHSVVQAVHPSVAPHRAASRPGSGVVTVASCALC